jgi:hypothetical protein
MGLGKSPSADLAAANLTDKLAIFCEIGHELPMANQRMESTLATSAPEVLPKDSARSCRLIPLFYMHQSELSQRLMLEIKNLVSRTIVATSFAL